MRFRTIVGALMAPALAISAASAQTGSAATCGDLSAVTFGSTSNSADKTQVVCNDFGGGVFVDMSAVARFNGLNMNPPPVVEVSPGVYMASNGAGNPAAAGLAQWNFNYAIVGTTGGTFQLLIDRDPGAGVNFQTFALVATPPCNQANDLCYQNSENEGFFNVGADVFDPNQTGTYTFEVQQLDAVGGIKTASINVVVASPEPASIALMATGFVGLAGFVRRRRNSNAA